VSLIKKIVIHLWNPEMGYLNKQLGIGIIAFFSLQLTMHKRIMDCVIALLDGTFFLLFGMSFTKIQNLLS
jgi:hypothetical protein